MRRFFVETFTLDADTEGGDNENDEQLNTRTDDHQPAHAEAMEITPDHPVYVEGKGWLWAENLAVGDRLRRADGGMAKVLAVERVKLAEPELVYNFTVKGPHTYFVLEVGVLVHNVESCGPYERYVEYLEPNSSPRKRTVEPIPGLYESIPLDPNDLPPGWKITSEDVFRSDTFSFIDTKVEFDLGNGKVAKGTFSRIYDSETKTLTLRHAYLQDPHVPDAERLPDWIRSGTPLDPNRGTPTATFFTLYQMKKLGIPSGGLERVKWSQVVNENTLLHLEWLRRNYPDKPLKELIAHTHSIRYAETSIIQSGHKIVPGSFALKVNSEVPISELRTAPFRAPNYERLQEFYGLHNVADDTPIIHSIREITVQVQKVP